MNNLIEKRFIDHFELLSAAIYILSKSVVSEQDIEQAETMLNEFCDLFETYFGISAVTMNIHLLRHYGYIVRNSGPLWSYSLFGFESNMGVLSRYWSGGIHVIDQIANKYVISKSYSESQPEKVLKYSLNILTNDYDHILDKYNMQCNDGKTKQIVVNKTYYQ